MNNITKNIILFPFNILYKISPEADLKGAVKKYSL